MEHVFFVGSILLFSDGRDPWVACSHRIHTIFLSLNSYSLLFENKPQSHGLLNPQVECTYRFGPFQTSFGFWIDTGNGVVTMIPTALLSYGATWDVPGVSARALGVVGLVFNYQMLYGTVRPSSLFFFVSPSSFPFILSPSSRSVYKRAVM